MNTLLRFPNAVTRNPDIDTWMHQHPGVLGEIARRWFDIMRHCGDDVRELLHDGHPTACVGDAAFGYVNAFRAHVNVGFFRGAEVADPNHLLEGTGRFMRHVKLRPERAVDALALTALIETAYADMKRRLRPQSVTSRMGNMKKPRASQDQPASGLISGRIAELGDWRGKTLGRMRALIRKADPDVVEEWKWSTPVWSHDGIVCTGETYKKVVKLTFARGASLEDPARLFNSSLDGKTRRAIDIHEGDVVDERAFTALVRGAVAVNQSRKPSRKRPTTIAEYIRSAPREGQPHLRRLYAILKSVAPAADETIKWGTPFFVEPRFLFAFSAHKAHVNFAPMAAGLEAFRKELKTHRTTRNYLQVPYDTPLPEDLIRRIAKYCLRNVSERKDGAFW